MKKHIIWWIKPLSKECRLSLLALFGGGAKHQKITTKGKRSLYQVTGFDDVVRYINFMLRCNFFKQEGHTGEIKPWVPSPRMIKKAPFLEAKTKGKK